MIPPILIFYLMGFVGTIIILLLTFREELRESHDPGSMGLIISLAWPLVWIIFCMVKMYEFLKTKEEEEMEENSFKIQPGDYD